MSDNSAIEWTDSTWSPTLGCTNVSEGCDHCYAMRTVHRMAFNPNEKVSAAAEGLTAYRPGVGVVWTNNVRTLPERLGLPLKWKKPRRIFVDSQSDLFHDRIPDEFIADVFAVMALARQHTFQVLTKRHARMRSLLGSQEFAEAVNEQIVHWAVVELRDSPILDHTPNAFDGPLPNVHLGVSVENQHWATIRVGALRDTPAAVRFLSCEPLLGPLSDLDLTGIGWLIAGGESGPRARPMHPDWARSLRDRCVTASVPFLFKQWGEWGPAPWRVDRADGELVEDYKARAESVCATHAMAPWAHEHGHELYEPPHKPWSVERVDGIAPHAPMRRWGKKLAGRELDSRTWDEYPQEANVTA